MFFMKLFQPSKKKVIHIFFFFLACDELSTVMVHTNRNFLCKKFFYEIMVVISESSLTD